MLSADRSGLRKNNRVKSFIPALAAPGRLGDRRQQARRNRARKSWTKSRPSPIIWPQKHDDKIKAPYSLT